MLCARFLGKISQFSFSRLNSVFVFVFSPFSLVLFFLVYFKLHINKLTTRTVILVRIYLIDTCAVFLSLSLYLSFCSATKCYLSFCLVFFRVQPQKNFLSSVCVCISLMAVLYALSLFFSEWRLSLFFFSHLSTIQINIIHLIY
jgi:hypothetical protein